MCDLHGKDGRMNGKLEYVISLGIIGFGIWIIAETKAGSALFPLWIALGGLAVAVGLLSLLAELRNRGLLQS